MRKRRRKLSLGRVIAKRVIERWTGSEHEKVTISLGVPRRESNNTWWCPFFIEGVDSQFQGMGGVDAFQALTLALQAIRVVLDSSGQKFRWLERPGAGLPILVSDYSERFEKRVASAIEREKDRYWKERLETRKAEVKESEAELKKRKAIIIAWERKLEERKKHVAAWEADQRKGRKEEAAKRRAQAKSARR